MSTVQVTQPHTLGRDTARSKLTEFEEMLAKYKVKLAWKGDQAKIKGVGVSGSVGVTDDAVDVRVKLGMLAKAAGIDPKRLEGSIRRRLEHALTGEG